MNEQTRRQAYEQRQRRNSLLIAALSTTIVISTIVVLLPRAPRWDRVKKSFFDREIFLDSFPRLVEAFWLDIKIFLWSMPLIFALSLAIAVSRNTRSPALFPVRAAAVIYTDVFRGVPVILTIFLIGFGVPGLFDSRTWSNPLIWGTVALVLSYSAYVSEEIRAGIEGIHESQRAAARSLGMTSSQTMSTVVLPQAMRRIVPPMMNSIVSLQKDVALISLIGPIEILRQAGLDKSKFANFTPYVAAAVIFLCVTIPLTRVADHLLARERRRTGAASVS
jgi:polar amino acid transport system permease protein